MTTAKEIMTTRVVVCYPHETLRDAAERMHHEHISGMPVVDGDMHIYGIVTEADIMRFLYPFPSEEKTKAGSWGEREQRGMMRWFLESADYEANAESFAMLKKTSVADVMTKDVVGAAPSDGVGHIVRLMQERQVNRIPVVEKGKVTGIVTRADVVRMAAGGSMRKKEVVPELGYR